MIERAEDGLRPGGFGMLIVRQIVDELVYNERGQRSAADQALEVAISCSSRQTSAFGTSSVIS